MRSRQNVEKRADAMNLKQSVKTLWPYITKFKGRVFIALLALIGAKGATLLMPVSYTHLTLPTNREV